jgi:hypothetical protein
MVILLFFLGIGRADLLFFRRYDRRQDLLFFRRHAMITSTALY